MLPQFIFIFQNRSLLSNECVWREFFKASVLDYWVNIVGFSDHRFHIIAAILWQLRGLRTC